jgi:hypothetical protein
MEKNPCVFGGEQNNTPCDEPFSSYDTMLSESRCVVDGGKQEEGEVEEGWSFVKGIVRAVPSTSSLSSLFSTSSSSASGCSDEGSDIDQIIVPSTPFKDAPSRPIEGRFLIDGAWRFHDLRLRGKDSLRASKLLHR